MSMEAEITREHDSCSKYLEELSQGVSDEVHKRLIEAYRGENPVESMESELRKIIMEVVEG